MAKHITILPASTKAGKAAIQSLLNSEEPPLVRGIYRDVAKAPAEFTQHPNFEAKSGDVSTGLGLDFSRSEAVFYVPPPIYDGSDVGEFATRAATNVKRALQDAPSVQKLLLFSSMGAQYDHGIGILKINHVSDTLLKDSVPEVRIAKAGYFQENWAHGLETAQSDPPVLYSPITPIDHKVPMVSIVEVGEVCARILLDEEKKESPYFFDLFGPRDYSSLDVKRALEEVTGKSLDLISIEKGNLGDFFAQQVPPHSIPDLVDMVTAALPGGIMANDFKDTENTVRGDVDITDALRKLYPA